MVSFDREKVDGIGNSQNGLSFCSMSNSGWPITSNKNTMSNESNYNDTVIASTVKPEIRSTDIKVEEVYHYDHMN